MEILVTGGGTVAPIDDVRAIANASTGRFSAAITEAFLRRGDRATHLHAPGAILPFDAATRIDPDGDLADEFARLLPLKAERDAARPRLSFLPLRLGTVAEYAEALRSALLARPFDAVLLAMAASDYAPEAGTGKISSDLDELTIRCRRLPKVIRSARDWAPLAYLVGFKLGSDAPLDDLLDRAARANAVNRTDLTVANDLRTLREGRHAVHLVRPGEATEALGPGPDLAARLVERVAAWAARR